MGPNVVNQRPEKFAMDFALDTGRPESAEPTAVLPPDVVRRMHPEE